MHDAGLPFAGSGESLREARKPVYVDTRSGRVGLIAATSNGVDSRAVDSSADTPARPGLNPLGFTSIYEVDEAAMTTLRKLDQELGFAQKRVRDRAQFYPPASVADPPEGTAQLGGLQFRTGKGFSVLTQVNQADARANLDWIREAARQSDWQVFSLHTHEFGPAGRLTAKGDPEMYDPADYWVSFAHQAVDAGTDVVFGHGPHTTLGIEIYNGRPIFYSVGNFIFQNDTIETVPPGFNSGFGLPGDAKPGEFMDARSGNGTRSFEAEPEFWQAFVPLCEFRASKLSKLTLYPVDLGYGTGRADRGRPVLAKGDIARRILERLAMLSQRFGTQITIQNGVGIVRV
jgi:poly-gamma-glutamate synthesis protein (capsule biosynthesis protein)